MELKADLDNLYDPACCDHGHKLTAGDDELDKMAKHLVAMYQDIWEKKGMPKGINKPVTQAFAKKLWGGVTEGYGKDFGSVAYDSPDYNMLANLQKNVYAFSAAKNWQQMKSITQALISEDGKGLKTFNEFRKSANEITGEHLRWLKTEYDTAIAGGQMAGKWVDIEANKDSLPYLEFDAVMDRRTSALCSGFNGVLLPINDPFWKQYYPPNHFGCRSTVRQRSGGKVTDSKDIVFPEKLPEMFKVNLGQNGLIFPPGHPYFIGLPDRVVLSFGDANYKLDTVRELRGSDGKVYESGIAYDPSKKLDSRYYKEYNMRLDVADKLASHFKTDIFMCPDFQAPQDDWRYPYFFKNVKPYSQPDFFFNNKHWELKSYENGFNYGKLSKMIRRAADKQSDRIILKINHDISIENAKKSINGLFEKSSKVRQKVKEMIIIDKDGVLHPIK